MWAGGVWEGGMWAGGVWAGGMWTGGVYRKVGCIGSWDEVWAGVVYIRR